MRTIIAGDPDTMDLSLVDDAIASAGLAVTEVVARAALGVDQLGAQWAAARRVAVRTVPSPPKRPSIDDNTRPQAPELTDQADALIAVVDALPADVRQLILDARRHDLAVYVHRSRRPNPVAAP